MQFHLRQALAILALSAAGCAGTGKERVSIPDARALSGENREWWNVYSLELQGERKVRTKVGYVYRKFSREDPKGGYRVKDLELNDVGFILADFQAFQTLPPGPGRAAPKAVPVGTTDLLGGIKRILQGPGAVALEKDPLLPEAPTGAAPTSPAPARPAPARPAPTSPARTKR